MPNVLSFADELITKLGADQLEDKIKSDSLDFLASLGFKESVNNEAPTLDLEAPLSPSESAYAEINNDTLSSGTNPTIDILNSGINNSHIREPNPNYNAGEGEQVISKGMAFIVLGRDRVDDPSSGYGGKGNTHASAIDIVAGMGGILSREITPEGEQVVTNKSPYLDSARIYISQRTDIDDNFGLVEGSDPNLYAQSGIAIKADGVRLVGRSGIKLVTGTDAYNSQGVGIDGEIAGIDLIAGNNTDHNKLEPLVKGESLASGLKELTSLMRDINGSIIAVLLSLIDLHREYATHIHVVAPAVGGPTTPPNGGLSVAELIVELVNYGLQFSELYGHSANTKTWELNHLVPLGENYINSRFNNTN